MPSQVLACFSAKSRSQDCTKTRYIELSGVMMMPAFNTPRVDQSITTSLTVCAYWNRVYRTYANRTYNQRYREVRQERGTDVRGVKRQSVVAGLIIVCEPRSRQQKLNHDGIR